MVDVEMDMLNRKLTLHAEIITYGNVADEMVTHFFVMTGDKVAEFTIGEKQDG